MSAATHTTDIHASLYNRTRIIFVETQKNFNSRAEPLRKCVHVQQWYRILIREVGVVSGVFVKSVMAAATARSSLVVRPEFRLGAVS